MRLGGCLAFPKGTARGVPTPHVLAFAFAFEVPRA
jgi:hypothetical protein